MKPRNLQRRDGNIYRVRVCRCGERLMTVEKPFAYPSKIGKKIFYRKIV
jgi:hypothetical protein